MRKTIKIEALVDRANHMLANSTCSRDIRLGVATLLESMLHEANAYNGYRHLSQSEVPRGQLAGIVGEPGKFEFPDDSRRQYGFKK